MEQTVLVDPQGWTMYELGRVVSDEDALRYLNSRWYGPYKLELKYDNDAIPPQVWIQATFKPTGNVTVAAYIRRREVDGTDPTQEVSTYKPGW